MKLRSITVSIMVLAFLSVCATAQTTTSNFQGRLNDGSSPANGQYDLQFKLFDAITGGTQVGPTIDRPGLTLINGVFSTTLDFGASPFTGSNRFVEISVRRSGSTNAHVVLGARQQIMSVPFAVRSANATQADNATNAQNAVNAQSAVNAQNATNANTAQNSNSLGGITASSYARLNFPNLGDIAATNLATGGNLSLGGNAIQLGGSYGLAKAMVYVEHGVLEPASIIRCYNGQTGASTPATCGFSVVEPLEGVHNLNFGFPVDDRFVLVTVVNNTIPRRNYGSDITFVSGNLVVSTFRNESPNDTEGTRFMVFVY